MLYSSPIFNMALRYGEALQCKRDLQHVLVLQKRAIRILNNVKFRDTCREAFRELKIFIVTSLYPGINNIKELVSARSGHKATSPTTGTQRTTTACLFTISALQRKKTTYAGAKMWNAHQLNVLKKCYMLLFTEQLRN